MTAITLKGLTKRFGPPTAPAAVDHIDLTINSGELFFLLGPSGCGKTTLLRMIAGFVEPTAGSIHFDNQDVISLPPNRRNTGMVFQSYALWPHMTVAENVAYGLKVRRVSASERAERVAAALKAVHMEQYAGRKPNQLSGGQQQRVALARALVIQPTVLLLDEPLSNLDAKLRSEMRWEIRRICKQARITTVYVTHDQKEALSMADSMAVLRDGRIVQMGAPSHLYRRPNSRFVADFLGESNFLEAKIHELRPGSTILATAAGLIESSDSVEGLKPGQKVLCSIRPECVQLDPDPTTPNRIQSRISKSQYLGEVAQHELEVNETVTIRVLELNPQNTIAADRVNIGINAADIAIIHE